MVTYDIYPLMELSGSCSALNDGIEAIHQGKLEFTFISCQRKMYSYSYLHVRNTASQLM